MLPGSFAGVLDLHRQCCLAGTVGRCSPASRPDNIQGNRADVPTGFRTTRNVKVMDRHAYGRTPTGDTAPLPRPVLGYTGVQWDVHCAAVALSHGNSHLRHTRAPGWRLQAYSKAGIFEFALFGLSMGGICASLKYPDAPILVRRDNEGANGATERGIGVTAIGGAIPPLIWRIASETATFISAEYARSDFNISDAPSR